MSSAKSKVTLKTFEEKRLSHVTMTERVQKIRDAYFEAMPEICVERPDLISHYHVDHNLLGRDKISILEKARAYRYFLENRTVTVWPTTYHGYDRKEVLFDNRSLFAGSTTSKFKGVILYPEFMAQAIWPELDSITKRTVNPYWIDPNDADKLNLEIFPKWLDNTLLELARSQCEDYPDAGVTREDFQLFQQLVFYLVSKPETISHTIPDFTQAINKGLDTIQHEVQAKALTVPEPEKQEFYLAVHEVLQGIINFSKRLGDQAARMALSEPDPERQQELFDLAAIHWHVPANPARTFREGLTTVWVCWIACHLENANVGLSLGRLDQILHELYRKDMQSGMLKDVNQAVELLCCLWLKIGDHVPMVPEAGEQLFGGAGSNQAITIGGVTKDGKDAVNDLTYVILRATELVKLRDPNLNARYMKKINSEDYLRRLCDANITTGATPAIHNDQALIEALCNKDPGAKKAPKKALQHARDYGIVGCVEPSSCGRQYGHSGAILLNLCAILELTLFNGKHRHTRDKLISLQTGDPALDFNTFADFQEAFETQTNWMAETVVKMNNWLGRIHQLYYPTPILSALFEGPLETGKDLVQGGAVLNSSGVAVIGMADVIDSLAALKKVVYQEKYSFADFIEALQANFEGQQDYETLGHRLRNHEKTPKYGDHDEANELAVWVSDMLDNAFKDRKNYRHGDYRVGYWTITIHSGIGRLTKALPNGRKNYECLASGITPVSGSWTTPALTKALNGVASLHPHSATNGMAFNVKYSPVIDGYSCRDKEMSRDELLDKFVAYTKGFFAVESDERPGGVEIQFNVTSHDEFVEAVLHPEQADPTLLVRVSGYTAYFKDLNPMMQKEIIDRTEYCLKNGQAEYFPPFELPAK